MKIQYFSGSDMLTIDLSDAPATGGSVDAAEGILFEYDDQDRLVGIEISDASERVDMTDIKKTPDIIINDSTEPIISYTVTALAEEWEVSTSSIQKTIQAMRKAGPEVGKQHGPTFPIILYEGDVTAIEQWREAHPQGRPKEKAVGS
jgi:uncharacterized protein YuzE